jgi:DNA repair protein RadD
MTTVAPADIPILRDYQQRGVAEIRARFAAHRRVLYVAPTGSGKTICFVYVAVHAALKGHRCIIISHRAEIADQISNALAAMGVAHGRIQPGHTMTDDLVQVGMVQSVSRRLGKLAEPTLLVVDEAHHAVAGTWQNIAAAWTKSKVLGITATPERQDGVGLRDAFDEMVIGADVRELIDGGHLAPFRYLAPSTAVDLSRVRTLGGDYNAAELAAAVDQGGITGDVIEHYLKHLAGRTAVAFCVTIAHAARGAAVP